MENSSSREQHWGPQGVWLHSCIRGGFGGCHTPRKGRGEATPAGKRTFRQPRGLVPHSPGYTWVSLAGGEDPQTQELQCPRSDPSEGALDTWGSPCPAPSLAKTASLGQPSLLLISPQLSLTRDCSPIICPQEQPWKTSPVTTHRCFLGFKSLTFSPFLQFQAVGFFPIFF